MKDTRLFYKAIIGKKYTGKKMDNSNPLDIFYFIFDELEVENIKGFLYKR